MRIMAVDYGDAHTGVAISDPTGMLAGWTTTINSRSQDVVVEQLKAIIAQRGVEELVLGYPKNMNDTKGERVIKSEALAARLGRRPACLSTCGMSGSPRWTPTAFCPKTAGGAKNGSSRSTR